MYGVVPAIIYRQVQPEHLFWIFVAVEICLLQHLVAVAIRSAFDTGLSVVDFGRFRYVGQYFRQPFRKIRDGAIWIDEAIYGTRMMGRARARDILIVVPPL